MKCRKRSRREKSKTTPDLNLSFVETSALIPTGLVNVRVTQLACVEGKNDGMEELLKKHRRSSTTNVALSAAAAEAVPVGHNELPKRFVIVFEGNRTRGIF